MMMSAEEQRKLENLDRDSESRYDVEKLWYPDRIHKIDNFEGPVDFLGDESFYAPSLLGRAEVSPGKIVAGQTSPLTLQYYCGKRSLTAGDRVRFYMRGQSPLGCTYQLDDPGEKGWFTVTGPEHCTIRPVVFGFVVESGALQEGDCVTIRVNDPIGFKFTPISGRYEFKTVFHFADADREQRLASAVVVEVLPDAAVRLEATRSCTVRAGMPNRLHITLRDRFDNRVPFAGILTVSCGGCEASVPMTNGLADYELDAESACQPVEVRFPAFGLSTTANPCITAEENQLYVGDLHVHDFLSEAHQYTDRVYDWALEDRNMDFVSVSIQTHGWIDNQKWAIEKYHSERYLQEGRFVTLLANEWQHTAFGDKVIHHLGNDQPFLCVDDSRYNTAAKLYDAVRDSDAVIISHHCSYPAGSWCGSTNFPCVDTQVERLTELWSMHGSSEGFVPGEKPLSRMDQENTVMAALRMGLRLGFVAGSDTHSGRPGGSAKEPMAYWGGQACIWARELTRAGIMEALKARRTYGITGARIILQMTVNGADMGSEIPLSDTAEIRIRTVAPSTIEKIQIIKNTKLLKEVPVNAEQADITVSDLTEGAAFYHCRVLLADGNLAVCSPVWVG